MSVLLDVGSHKGTYTDLFIKNYKIKKAFIFEPQNKIFEYIKKKYSKKTKVFPFNNAVSNFQGKKKFLINKHDITSSFTKLNNKNNYLKFKSILFGGKSLVIDSYYVQSIKLDNFIKKKKIKKIDLLKIDTEGHEYQVLLGLRKKIHIVKSILIEFHNDKIYKNYNSKKIHLYLTKNNFKLEKKIKFPFTEWEDRIYFSKN